MLLFAFLNISEFGTKQFSTVKLLHCYKCIEARCAASELCVTLSYLQVVMMLMIGRGCFLKQITTFKKCTKWTLFALAHVLLTFPSTICIRSQYWKCRAHLETPCLCLGSSSIDSLLNMLCFGDTCGVVMLL